MKGIMGTGRIARVSLVTLAAALALTLAFAPARGAPITVPSPGFATITTAVLLASPGDTIIIKKGGGTGNNGEYHEAVFVTKTLTIICKGAVLDGAIPSNLGTGPAVLPGDGFNIGGNPAANGTTVRGCTVQNFDGDDDGDEVDTGDGIDVDADDVTIQNNTFINNSSDGLELSGKGFLVKGNTAIDNGGGNGSDGFFFPNESDGDDNSDGTVVGNVAIANRNDGFRNEDNQSTNNKYLNNRAFRNDGDGFEPGPGSTHAAPGAQALALLGQSNFREGMGLRVFEIETESEEARSSG